MVAGRLLGMSFDEMKDSCFVPYLRDLPGIVFKLYQFWGNCLENAINFRDVDNTSEHVNDFMIVFSIAEFSRFL